MRVYIHEYYYGSTSMGRFLSLREKENWEGDKYSFVCRQASLNEVRTSGDWLFCTDDFISGDILELSDGDYRYQDGNFVLLFSSPK